MSSGGRRQQTQTQTSQSGPPTWAIPYFQQNLEQANRIAGRPYQAYTGERVAGLGVTNPYATNQYSDDMIQSVQRDITDNYMNSVAPNLMAQFNMGGAYGGSAHMQALQGAQQGLARGLADASTDIRYRNADNLRNDWYLQLARQQQANDYGYQNYLDARDWDVRNLDIMNNALRNITGGTSTSSATGPNPNYRSAGQNALAYGAIIASMFGGGG